MARINSSTSPGARPGTAGASPTSPPAHVRTSAYTFPRICYDDLMTKEELKAIRTVVREEVGGLERRVDEGDLVE